MTRPRTVSIRTKARGLVPAARSARTTVLTLGGFGALTASAWTVATGFGLAAAGVSLLLLEYLTADGGPRR